MDLTIDLKTVASSRFGLFLWQIAVLVALKANYKLHTEALLESKKLYLFKTQSNVIEP